MVSKDDNESKQFPSQTSARQTNKRKTRHNEYDHTPIHNYFTFVLNLMK